jgi:hypothetical protein
MLRNRETSHTTQLLEAVCGKLDGLRTELHDSRTENRDLKRRVEYLEGELAKRACWDPSIQRERERSLYLLPR